MPHPPLRKLFQIPRITRSTAGNTTIVSILTSLSLLVALEVNIKLLTKILLRLYDEK